MDDNNRDNSHVSWNGTDTRPLVSVITPAFNSGKYIRQTIESVLSQTMPDFEMIIADDCSEDETCAIVKQYAENDDRVKLLCLEINSGAAEARNAALEKAEGRFIAYLDSDDIWMPDKLERQIQFMMEKDCGFSCASYEIMADDGRLLNTSVHIPEEVDYHYLLTNNILQTVGIMVDTAHVDRRLLQMPLIRRGQDLATWLQILKSGTVCFGLDMILARYRRTKNSLSSNKIKDMKRTWHVYRRIEKLSFPYCCYCFVRYALLAVLKRIGGVEIMKGKALHV